MHKFKKITGLVAAAHTPFLPDGSLNLGAVEKQAAHLLQNNIHTAFIAGSTGESHSLSVDERRQLSQRWLEVTRGTKLEVIVHVGSNCLVDAVALAAHAQKAGAAAISALAPSYFKPKSLSALLECCAAIASAAPELSFYFYDIPVLTGVNLSMLDFLEQGRAKIPTLAGIKWTNTDMNAYQLCQRVPGDFDLPWGIDECLLAALSGLGAVGAVGSTYFFAAPIYQRMLEAFVGNDLVAARKEQFRSVQLIQLLAGYGYLGAAKTTSKLIGVDVGPARLPNSSLSREQEVKLHGELEHLGYFDWIKN